MSDSERFGTDHWANELYSPDRPLRGLVESVCIRPTMYTIGGTLEEVGAFLEGYYSGLAHSSSAGAQAEVEQVNDFWWWLSERLTGTGTSGWYSAFTALRRAFPGDAVAFARLAALHVEFRERYAEMQAAQQSP